MPWILTGGDENGEETGYWVDDEYTPPLDLYTGDWRDNPDTSSADDAAVTADLTESPFWDNIKTLPPATQASLAQLTTDGINKLVGLFKKQATNPDGTPKKNPDGTPDMSDIDWAKITGLGAAGISLFADKTPITAGSTLPIPNYSVARSSVQYDDANRLPGALGRDYFSETRYTPVTGVAATDTAARAADLAAVKAETTGIASQYKPPVPATNPYASGDKMFPTKYNPTTAVGTGTSTNTGIKTGTGAATNASGVANLLPIPDPSKPVVEAAEGGLMSFAKGGNNYLRGSTDGMADKLNTSIDNRQAAKLSHGEFVIPADVVSHLGNGNSDAGADKLYQMMARIRKARTGNPRQGKRINPDKFMPGGLATLNMGGSVQDLQTQGRGGDTMLAHINPQEAMVLKAMGGSGVINPNTGLREFDTNATTTGTANTSTAPKLGTSTSSSLSPWAAPYVTSLLGKTQAEANAPYTAYKGPLVAGTSDLQNQAFAGAQTVAGAGYDPTKFTSGTFGAAQAQKYMNPYLSAVLDPQMKELQRQADITRVGDAGRMTQAGAYGGSRQAIAESEGRKNLLNTQAATLGQGYASAYDKAMGQFNTQADRDMGAQKASEDSRQFSANFGLKSLADLERMGATQRQIAGEGIAADKAQFEEQRNYPKEQLKFQRDMITGLPISTAATTANTSQSSNAARDMSNVNELLKILGIIPK